MICFTYSPLYIITSFGIIFVAIGLILLIYGLFTSFSTTISQNIQLIPIILFLGLGFLMISNGIIGIYLANIYDEIKGRPQYIIDYKI